MDDIGAGQLVMPPLIVLIECNPEKSEVAGQTAQ
jgi:hypothetical protein